MALKDRLENDESVQELRSQYVMSLLDEDCVEYPLWMEKFPPINNVVPIMYLVSPQGELLILQNEQLTDDEGNNIRRTLENMLEIGLKRAQALAEAAP